MARQDIRARLQGQDPNRNNLKGRLQQLGTYNQTHAHGEALGKYNQSHVAGASFGGPISAQHDPSMDIAGLSQGRKGAPQGPVPPWVLAAMQRRQAGNIPQGVTPTKPQGPAGNPLLSPTGPNTNGPRTGPSDPNAPGYTGYITRPPGFDSGRNRPPNPYQGGPNNGRPVLRGPQPNTPNVNRRRRFGK